MILGDTSVSGVRGINSTFNDLHGMYREILTLLTESIGVAPCIHGCI